ncbi:hypothetical protein J7E73_31415 [Paenibacillus albidus]|uniref:hypothetical protein n=1 Tax=Paenibacillus albidus TaxID=2041023 RepID=UPI001BEA4683|nr:hypothetical protein [Paenibacillus albidus]MBT2293522.1 hypothetical protein [Paenibacillus albidus]
MNSTMEGYFKNLESPDKELQYEAFTAIQSTLMEPVDWAYEVWDKLKAQLVDPGNHQRSRAAQFLCGLAISDPEGRILQDLPALLEVTRDKRFVTARHALQSVWRIGLAGQKHKQQVLHELAGRYRECAGEKNGTLLRFDIIESLRKLYEAAPDEEVRQLALSLIEAEEDLKYRKKYAAVWKK